MEGLAEVRVRPGVGWGEGQCSVTVKPGNTSIKPSTLWERGIEMAHRTGQPQGSRERELWMERSVARMNPLGRLLLLHSRLEGHACLASLFDDVY